METKSTLVIIVTVLIVALEVTESKSLILNLVITKRCSREGLICRDCKTLVRCTPNAGGFAEVVEKVCEDDVLCNDSTLKCDKIGKCRGLLETVQPTEESETLGESILTGQTSNLTLAGEVASAETPLLESSLASANDLKATTTEGSAEEISTLMETTPATTETSSSHQTTSTATTITKEQTSTTSQITSSTEKSTTSATESTSPTVTDKPNEASNYTCKNEGYFENPSNCTMFYMCKLYGGNLVAYNGTCRSGSHFDKSSKKCVRGECQTTTTVSPPSVTCQTEGIYSDPSNCTNFYTCKYNGSDYDKKQYHCRNGSYFDGSVGRCVLGSCERTSKIGPLVAAAGSFDSLGEAADGQIFSLNGIRRALVSAASYLRIR